MKKGLIEILPGMWCTLILFRSRCADFMRARLDFHSPRDLRKFLRAAKRRGVTKEKAIEAFLAEAMERTAARRRSRPRPGRSLK